MLLKRFRHFLHITILDVFYIDLSDLQTRSWSTYLAQVVTAQNAWIILILYMFTI